MMSKAEAKADAEKCWRDGRGGVTEPVADGPCGTADCTPDLCEAVCDPAQAVVWPMCGPPNQEAQRKADEAYNLRRTADANAQKAALDSACGGCHPDAVTGSGFLCPHGEDYCEVCIEADESVRLISELIADDEKGVTVDWVNHPPHYTAHPSGVECIDVTEHYNFCIGNAIKYLWRAGLKGDATQDLEKAVWYIQREIQRRNREA